MKIERNYENRNIYKIGNKYSIRRGKNRKIYHYGSYNTLNEARKKRDYYEDRGWLLEDSKTIRNIQHKKRITYINKRTTKTGESRYRIYKKLSKGHQEYFGTYKTRAEAEKAVQYFKAHGWNKKDVHYTRKRDGDPLQYISKVKLRNGLDCYKIQRGRNGTTETYGTFHTLEDAIKERDLLVQCEWNIDDYYELPF